jgi:hypothetical protein
VLDDVEQVRRGALAADARVHAPSALAHAEKLRREAEAAFEDDDVAGSQILADHALAAYAHAHALSRVARADMAARAAEADLTKSRTELASLEADQARESAELDALELRIKVVRDAQAIVPSGPADPAREKARLAAARALTLQARLLCGAARLLLAEPRDVVDPKAKPAPTAPPGPGVATPAELGKDLEAATAAVTKLEAELATSPAAAPIDSATRARAGCLSALTAVRRAGTSVTRAPGAGDALLAQLSATRQLSPGRDDRGVVVTLRNAFRGDALAPTFEQTLGELGRIAAAHPRFPLVVVVHDAEAAARARPGAQARADAAARALKASGATRVETVLAGGAAPVVDPGGADRARNARLEVVFVTPETF